MCSGVDDSWGHDSLGGDSSVGVSLGVVTVGAMTGRVKRLDGGDSEGGDCWGSREVEINTIIRSSCRMELPPTNPNSNQANCHHHPVL